MLHWNQLLQIIAGDDVDVNHNSTFPTEVHTSIYCMHAIKYLSFIYTSIHVVIAQIDLIDMRLLPHGEKKWILQCVDYCMVQI